MAFSHFQYWNPELVCGSLWFGCFSWAKAAELSQEAWGDGCSPCLGFADAGDWTASQKHAMHTLLP